MVGYETSLRGIYRYMEIKKEYKDDIVILHISGYMVADTIDKLKETIQKCQDEKINKVILNLELVKMIDSSGIGAIAFMVKRFRLTKGDVKIAHARGHVADIFQMIRLYKTIEIYPSVDESLKSFTG